jgi:hypothetical protein
MNKILKDCEEGPFNYAEIVIFGMLIAERLQFLATVFENFGVVGLLVASTV